MENLTEYKIKLPTLPDHLELCGPCVANEEHYVHNITDNVWEPAPPVQVGMMKYVIARRRETLAGWANKQRLFQALAEMRDSPGVGTIAIATIGDAWWGIKCTLQPSISMNLGVPPCSGKLRLEAGKWVDET